MEWKESRFVIMANMKSQFDIHLEQWAKEHKIENIIHDRDVFVIVDKYNKPIERRLISPNHFDKLSAAQKQKLESVRDSLPYESLYFAVIFDKKNHVFLIRKKTPIQNMLNIWAIVMIIWALYRWYFKTSLPVWFDEFIAKPLVFITPIYLYITQVEKKNFFSGVSLNKPLKSSSLFTGLFIGLIFFVTGFLSFFIRKQSVSFTDILSHLTTPLWLIVLIAFATAISEEIASRGFVLRRLFEDSRNMYTSTLYTSILFFFMHIPIFFTNDKIMGSTLIQLMATDFLFSFAVSFLYVESKNLYLPILVHALYNISIYLFSIS